MKKALAAGAAVITTAITAIALSPRAAAGHETLGGGTFAVTNSDGPCTYFTHGSLPYTNCAGSWVNLNTANSDYVSVPLGSSQWVSCATYTPYGQLFETDIEYRSEVPRKQQFWAERGWGPYEPRALCQLW